jgi:ABC-type glycerol-3-phosphate transport system permease component
MIRKSNPLTGLGLLVLFGITLAFIFPILWMVASSLESGDRLFDLMPNGYLLNGIQKTIPTLCRAPTSHSISSTALSSLLL